MTTKIQQEYPQAKIILNKQLYDECLKTPLNTLNNRQQ